MALLFVILVLIQPAEAKVFEWAPATEVFPWSPKHCDAHYVPTEVFAVPVHSGWFFRPIYRKKYERARARFPNAPEPHGSGCEGLGIPRVRVLACPRCSELKQEWIAAHGSPFRKWYRKVMTEQGIPLE